MIDNAIVITGGGQRLGLAFAKALHSKLTPVVITYRAERESITELQNLGIICIKADFSTDEGVANFNQFIQSNCSSLKAIIHNASDWLAESAAVSPSETMQSMMQVHVQAPYQLNLFLQPLLENYYLQTSNAADIIHLTDFVVGKGSKKHIAYAASKAALANLTLSFSALLAPKVKVNSIAPSLLMFNENDSDSYKQKTLKKSLMQIAPGEIEGVEAVQYLLNSRYITGHTLHLNGGRHLA
ncbi:dihydromonapterin reductase [Thalassotalea psychrophila]|uniref:Dihydromonapterin reductase n=1 Tax=Thalassotalea psychrophila TaxID=3065647 RepID=A0ABY9TS39_9GAMM|nr:dihydromonapterin reductase [Colwelliaceae bacterium SQ149]